MHSAQYQCPSCFEWIEITVDPSAGSRQSYVEDCQVCCRPNLLDIVWDRSAGAYSVTAQPES